MNWTTRIECRLVSCDEDSVVTQYAQYLDWTSSLCELDHLGSSLVVILWLDVLPTLPPAPPSTGHNPAFTAFCYDIIVMLLYDWYLILSTYFVDHLSHLDFGLSLFKSSLVLTAQEMAEQFVELEINGNKVVIFSKTYCPYCKMAKQVSKIRTAVVQNIYLSLVAEFRRQFSIGFRLHKWTVQEYRTGQERRRRCYSRCPFEVDR